MQDRPKPVIALTGLIGSGKSTVAGLFAAYGARIIDTDVIAHQLTAAGGSAIEALCAHFGDKYINLDGSLNRQLIRELVFRMPSLRTALEEILHPRILAQVKLELAENTAAAYSILAVPLLFRSKNYCELSWRSIFVNCEYAQIVQRLQQRSALKPAQIDAILAQQVAPSRQLELADDVIHNNSDIAALAEPVSILHNCYLLLR